MTRTRTLSQKVAWITLEAHRILNKVGWSEFRCNHRKRRELRSKKIISRIYTKGCGSVPAAFVVRNTFVEGIGIYTFSPPFGEVGRRSGRVGHFQCRRFGSLSLKSPPSFFARLQCEKTSSTLDAIARKTESTSFITSSLENLTTIQPSLAMYC